MKEMCMCLFGKVLLHISSSENISEQHMSPEQEINIHTITVLKKKACAIELTREPRTGKNIAPEWTKDLSHPNSISTFSL